MTELKPCPFCGGEAKFNMYRTTCSVDCQECRIGTYQVTLDDYKSAIAAWNNRYERTCRNVSKWPDERLECSECGSIADYASYEDEPFVMVDGVADIPNYCPNCGAKVVD